MTLSFQRPHFVALALFLLQVPSVGSQPADPADSGPSASSRRFAVADSIELSTFLYPAQQFGAHASRVRFSPDGSRFAAVTMRGDLDSGNRVATLWVFDSAAVRAYLSAPPPGDFAQARVVTRFSSTSNREPLSNWRWSSDSRALLFLGADGDGVARLYRVGRDGSNPAALSAPDQDVTEYDERDGAVAYLARSPLRREQRYQTAGPSLPDIAIGTGNSILSLLFANDPFLGESPSEQLWTIRDAAPVKVPIAATVRLKNSKLALSPDGGSVVVTPFVPRVPQSWERYRPLHNNLALRFDADTPETEGSAGHYRPRHYAVVDLASGDLDVLVDAPIEFGISFSSLSPQWTADATRIALPGAYPSLTGRQAGTDRVLPCEILVVAARSRRSSCVRFMAPAEPGVGYGDRLQMVSVAWRNGDRELVAQYASPNAPDNKVVSRFTQRQGRWSSQDIAAAAGGDELAVRVHQDLDEPPVLMAGIGRGTPRRLLDPNPQLAQIARGAVRLYRWRDARGDEWTGALVTPPGYSENRRYPLVIQTHNLDRARFLADGPSATGFAARALAARDIVVLQVDEIRRDFGTPAESATGAGGYRAAIAQLAREGIIDPTRVGIIGWSHMGANLLRALIDEPHAYAAATMAEASSTSYYEYLMNIDYQGTQREQMFRDQFGTRPFGEGLRTWVENSPGFQADRICTPLLFQWNSPPAAVYGWGDYAILRAQNKPVDLLYIRNGDHALVQPRQRLVEQGMNVDWYDYWLNGRKDPDPAKAGQYRRWDAIKVLRRCSDNGAGSTSSD